MAGTRRFHASACSTLLLVQQVQPRQDFSLACLEAGGALAVDTATDSVEVVSWQPGPLKDAFGFHLQQFFDPDADVVFILTGQVTLDQLALERCRAVFDDHGRLG